MEIIFIFLFIILEPFFNSNSELDNLKLNEIQVIESHSASLTKIDYSDISLLQQLDLGSPQNQEFKL